MAVTQLVQIVTPSASSTPVAGTASASVASDTFIPQLGRRMYLTLSGNWTGSVQIERSTDGTNFFPVTQNGGQPAGHYTANADEEVGNPTDSSGTYRLNITITSGSLVYRLGQ